MKVNKRCSIFGALLLVANVSVSSAQQGAPPSQQDIERMQQEYADRLRRSRLVGPNDSLAIEMQDGELIRIARGSGCLPPVSKAGVIKIDCTPTDGPAYYFDESTRAMIESCSFWFPDAKRCPPKQWPVEVEVEGCDGAVPQSIIGAWRLHAMPSSNGFYSVGDSWTMTFDERSIAFAFDSWSQRLTRSYRIVEGGGRRQNLELGDASSATTKIEVEFAPCGVLVEAGARCDAFCENFTREFGAPTEAELRAMIEKSLGGNVPEAEVQRLLEEVSKQPPQSLFPERAFFRAVSSD